MVKGMVWVPPRWDKNSWKHLLPAGARWAAAVPRTGQGKAWAKYHPSLTETLVEQMEMTCLDTNGQINTAAGWHEIPGAKPHIRMFWRHVVGLAHSLGASEGVETDFQYVEYQSSGSVHGRPISRAELVTKGIQP